MAKILPDWPRMLSRANAAAYLDITVPAFERELSSGRLPMPVMLGGQERWSRSLLDEAIERMTGAVVPDFRAQSNFYANR